MWRSRDYLAMAIALWSLAGLWLATKIMGSR